ncbi:MAG: isoleucine--tRNA ligase [Candidatus Woesearchaeota archaeon]
MVYEFKNVEKEILKYWENKKIYEKIKKRNSKGKSFYFLQGPPYTSGRLHIGHAWNHALKDQILRYKRMNRFNVWDRNGYDMHGLPTENKVQKTLGLKDKKEIEKYGIDKFVSKCKKFSFDMAQQMSRDLVNFGVWMDHEHAYMPIENDFIEGEWWFIKKAHDAGRIYEGLKTVTWCYSCETSLAKHELEYENVLEDSVFVKFKVKDTENEYLIIWTTTPWTLCFNLGVMVHPDLDYVRVKVKDEVWVVAKGLAGAFIQGVVDEKLKIIDEFKGNKLEGLRYEPLYYKELKEKYDKIMKESKKAFTVVLSEEYVDLSAGTGLVHMAPGCGPEDFEVGRRNGIPAFNNLKENGDYAEDMGKFSGWNAKKDSEKFMGALVDTGKLIAKTEVEHDYAHCWRCRSPVIYRATKQWFLKVEDLVPKMVEEIPKIKWVPKDGEASFNAWISNVKDNSITRQRYWGAPVPLWKCKECGDYVVVGSADELKKLGGKVPEDLHRPWIDKVELPCKCGSKKERISDVLDVWIDSGITSWTCLYFPQRKDLMDKLWPADLVLEGTEHTRLWFYMLHLASAVAFGKPSFKNVYMHGMLRDVEGVKMSKSLGNIISPYDIVDKYGIDTLRYYTSTQNAGEDMNFSWDEIKQRNRNLVILCNIGSYLMNYADKLSFRVKSKEVEDRYILSRLNSTVEKVTELMENYELDPVPILVEGLYLDLSRKYIQLVRARVGEKEVYEIIFKVLFESLKMFSITCPFITEKIYLDLKEKYKLKEESIHMFEWPKFDKKLIDKKLEDKFDLVFQVVKEALAQREKSGYGVRWPLPKLEVSTEENLKEFMEIVMKQVNVKKVEFKKGNFSVKLDTKITKELEREGYLREVLRRVQALRKKEGLNVKDRILLNIASDFDLGLFRKEIIEKVGAKQVGFNEKKYRANSVEKIKGKSFEISFQKV